MPPTCPEVQTDGPGRHNRLRSGMICRRAGSEHRFASRGAPDIHSREKPVEDPRRQACCRCCQPGGNSGPAKRFQLDGWRHPSQSARHRLGRAPVSP